MQPFFRKPGKVALYSEDLGEKRYKGKVVVLTSEGTASAAEGFAWHMKTKSDAKFI
jgi:C-terminal processing protease CtpA/Prc